MARDDEWEYSDEGGDEDEWEYHDAPSTGGAFASGAAQGATFNLGDEVEGAQQGTAAALLGAGGAALRGDWEGVKRAPELGMETYRAVRDGRRRLNQRDAAAHPTAHLAGQVSGALATGIATGGYGGVLGAGLRGAVTQGALEGALGGFGGSDADLTRADGEAYARAFTDSLEGSAYGAAFGAAGHGAGKLVRYFGGKARAGYNAAREALAVEARAGLDAEADALRAADAAEAARVEKAQGQALEKNKALDARAAREEARRVAQEARAAARAQRSPVGSPSRDSSPTPEVGPEAPRYPGHRRFVGDPNADPNTKVLRGYEGGAHRRRVDNAPKVAFARERLSRSDISPAERAEHEAYLAEHADAVDNPPAFRLRIIEDELIRKGYSPEVVRRAMARFDAQGRAVSRSAMPQGAPPALPEATRTAVPGPEDWLKRGHDPQEVIRQGGGGSAFSGPDAPTQVTDLPPPGTPSFSQEEVIARHRNARLKDEPADAWRSWREWETAEQTHVDGAPPVPPGYRRLYRVEGVEPGFATEPVRGHQWFTDRLGVADEQLQFREGGQGRMLYMDVPEAQARSMLALNRSAPRFAKASGDMGREWAVPDKMARGAEEFPLARESTADLEDLGEIAAATSGRPHWDRGIDGPFHTDEVLEETLAGPRPVAPFGADEVTGRMQPMDAVRQGRGPDLMRQGGGGSAFGENFANAKTRADTSMRPRLPMDDAFHDAPTRVGLVRTSPPEGIPNKWVEGPMHNFEFRDPTDGKVYEVVVSELPSQPDMLVFENIFPKEMGAHRALSKEGHAAAKNAVGPGVMKGVFAELARAFPGVRRVQAYRATGANAGRQMEMRLPEVTQRMDMGDVVKQGRADIGGGGPSAFGDQWANAPTRVDPAMQNGVQPFDVLGSRPALRKGQPYAAFNSDMVARDANYAAVRRLRQQGGSAPAQEPTAGARPRALPPEARASMRAPMDSPELTAATDTGVDPRFEATYAEGTRATRVPEVRRGALRPEATQVQPPPEATQVGGPSMFSERTRYAPPSMEQRLAGRPSVDSLVDERIAGGGEALRGAFWRGATGESGAMVGVAGLALGGPVGGLKALVLRGGLEVVREALRNPAAKARAIEAFKLQRLASVRPDVWARVSSTLQRAAKRDEESGTDYHLRAARHALLQTDPAFRAAEAEAAKELQGLNEDEVARRLVQ